MALEPAQIGRYKVLGALGQGSMGTVYLAEDPALKRGIALKTVRGGLGDQEALARFRREAEISAQISHPNIITIFDVGEEPGVGPFLAMEFVDGESLDAILKRGALDPEPAMALLLQAGQALEAIHRAGIVHRDVKPSNFMVSKEGRLKLMDFGVAKGGGPRLTATAAFLGTPAYAAPEALAGQEQPTESADLWALAVTAFELLTGSLPFAADSVNAVLYRVVHEPPQIPGGMDPALQAVFAKALAKEPTARHGSVPAFLKDLAEALPLNPSARAATLAQLDAQGLAAALYSKPRRAWIPKKAWIAVALLVALGAGAWALLSRDTTRRTIGIYSSPSGARAIFNGAELGRTPLPQVSIPGKGGTLRLEKQDYTPVEQEVGKDEDRITLRLVLAPYKVKVVTDPSGAEILLDGHSEGYAPTELTIPGEGRHTLEIQSDGYDSWETTLARHQPLPNPIRLNKDDHAKANKVKQFLKGLLDQ